MKIVEANIKSNGQALTTILHDHPDYIQTATLLKRDGCQPPGCNQTEIQYQATAEQLEALATISGNCTQAIRHECTNNGLTGIY